MTQPIFTLLLAPGWSAPKYLIIVPVITVQISEDRKQLSVTSVQLYIKLISIINLMLNIGTGAKFSRFVSADLEYTDQPKH